MCVLTLRIFPQILACVLANLCKFEEGEGGDVLVEWVNALNRWLRITLWNKEPDDVSLARSDELLWKFQKASEKIAHLRKNKNKEVISTGWNLPKMGQMALFVPATVRNGHPE